MSRFRFLIVVLTLSLLAACDDPPEPAAPAEKPARAVTQPDGDELPAPPRKVVEDTRQPKPAEHKPKPAAKVAPVEPLPPVQLDLHLPPELVEQLQPDELANVEVSRPALLPEMFVEKPKEPGPFELNGRLITNDRGDDYWDSVEGAELQFKFRN